MRDERLSALRVLLISAVICIHTFCVLDAKAYPEYRDVGIVLNVICHYAVPLFVMLSGIVLMNKVDEPLCVFYRKRMKRILVPLAPCAVFFVALRVFRDGDSVQKVLNDAICGHPYYHLWFAFMLLGVYALMPLLVRFVREVPAAVLSLGCCLVVCVSCLSGEGPYHVAPYAAYATIGMIAYRRCSSASHRIEGIVALALCAAVTFVNVRIVLATSSCATMGYCSPYVLVGSVSFLIAFLSLVPRGSGRRLGSAAGLTYGVYLWHPVFKGASMAAIACVPALCRHAWLVFPLTCASSFVGVWLFSKVGMGAVLLGTRK